MSFDPDRNVMMPHGAAMDLAEQEIRYLGDVQKLDLGPDDIVIVSVDRPLSRDMAERLRQTCSEALGDRKVLILDKGVKIGVFSPAS